MTVKEFASELKAAVLDIKSRGQQFVRCDDIINYANRVIDSAEAEPSVVDMEGYRAALQGHNESSLEMFRSVITAGQAAIRSSLILNGGAALALLAFIGHLAQFNASKVNDFAECMLPFTVGALAIVVVSGFTYLSQWLYASASSIARKAGGCLNICCIVLGGTSYCLFAWGLCEVYQAFSQYVPTG